MPINDDMTREELAERVEELEETVDDLQNQQKRAVTKTTLNIVLDALGGQQLDVADYTTDPASLRQDIERIADHRAEARSDAKLALGTAGQIDNGQRADGGPGKTTIAKQVSRNAVVKRALTQAGVGGSVEAREVIDMCQGRNTPVDHRIVYEAWKDAAAEWDELEVQDKPDRNKRLAGTADGFSQELVGVVNREFSEIDLTEQFITEGGR